MTFKISIKTEELGKVRMILDKYQLEGEIRENTRNTFDQDIQGHFVQINKKDDFNKFMELLENNKGQRIFS